MCQWGGKFFTPDYSQCIMNCQENVEALQFCTDLIRKHGFVPPPENFDSWIGFRQGKVGIAFEGIYMLADLQKQPNILVRISDIDVEGVREVDDKLVILARQLRCPILTNDYNLNRIAELQGVAILNVNELANAVKMVLLPGEPLIVSIIQEGKESGQGVGYLDDGTMVVVEDGRSYLNREVTVTVTKVLQTAAGRMIFARPESPTPEQ